MIRWYFYVCSNRHIHAQTPLIILTVKKNKWTNADNLRLMLYVWSSMKEENFYRNFFSISIFTHFFNYKKTRLFFPICFIWIASSLKNVHQSFHSLSFAWSIIYIYLYEHEMSMYDACLNCFQNLFSRSFFFS